MKKLILIILINSCFKSYKLEKFNYKDDRDIIEAILEGDLQKVKEEIAKGIDLEKQYGYHCKKRGFCITTPIYCAAESGYLEIFKQILKAIKNPDLNSAFLGAADGGHIEIAEEILKYFKNPNLDSALCRAVSEGKDNMVKYLFKKGANINCIIKDKILKMYTIPIIEAIKYDQFSTFIQLLELGAEPNIKSYLNCTPVMYVCHADGNALKDVRLKMLKELIKRGVSLIAETERKNNALFFSAWAGFTEAVDLLTTIGLDINFINIYGFTPLMLAAERGELEILKLLLERGANVNYVANCGNNVLTLAANKNRLHSFDEISSCTFNYVKLEDRVSVIEELIKYKVNFNQKIKIGYGKGKNALMISYHQGFLEATKTLILAGAPIEKFVKYALKQIIHKKDKKVLKMLFKYSSATPESLKLNLKLLEQNDNNKVKIFLSLIEEMIKEEKHNLLIERLENFVKNYN